MHDAIAVVTVACGLLCLLLVFRLVARVRAVRTGVRAEGRCVRDAWAGPAGNRKRVLTFGFTTADGRWVEFDEEVWSAWEGQRVEVAYDPRRPERSATVAASRPSAFFPQVVGVCVSAGMTAGGLLMMNSGFWG